MGPSWMAKMIALAVVFGGLAVGACEEDRRGDDDDDDASTMTDQELCTRYCTCVGCGGGEQELCVSMWQYNRDQAAAAGCSASFESFLACHSRTGECVGGEIVDSCAALEDAYRSCLPQCGWVEDGQCDEPEGTGLCPEGTDVVDCA